jgi:ubiquinone/menaquinone biosynthesis C-methylase UbiE
VLTVEPPAAAGIASLVLCSVPDQETALKELYRVIRPGGKLRFYAHVLAKTLMLAREQGCRATERRVSAMAEMGAVA